MKTLFHIALLIIPISVFAQFETDTLIKMEHTFQEVKIPKDYNYQYRVTLRRVRRVYPLALFAAQLIDSLEAELDNTKANRKKRRITNHTHRDLKEEFKYIVKDLYVSEGIILSKLIYKETGMTVEEIITKYKGGFHATLYNGIGALFDQELDAKYDPEGEDFILACVLQDIENNLIPFDFTIDKVTKEDYKQDQAESRARKKVRRKEKRKKKKNEKDVTSNRN